MTSLLIASKSIEIDWWEQMLDGKINRTFIIFSISGKQLHHHILFLFSKWSHWPVNCYVFIWKYGKCSRSHCLQCNPIHSLCIRNLAKCMVQYILLVYAKFAYTPLYYVYYYDYYSIRTKQKKIFVSFSLIAFDTSLCPSHWFRLCMMYTWTYTSYVYIYISAMSK